MIFATSLLSCYNTIILYDDKVLFHVVVSLMNEIQLYGKYTTGKEYKKQNIFFRHHLKKIQKNKEEKKKKMSMVVYPHTKTGMVPKKEIIDTFLSYSQSEFSGVRFLCKIKIPMSHPCVCNESIFLSLIGDSSQGKQLNGILFLMIMCSIEVS